MKNFLNRGGKLLLSGQNIGYDLVEDGSYEDSLFYADYLKAEYIEDNAEPIMVIGDPNDTIMKGTFINFESNADNRQSSPDVIKEIPPAKSILKYLPNQETAAIKYINETTGAIIIYLPFGIEGITGPYQNSAQTFLKKCMTLLSGTTEINIPSQNINVPKEYSLEQNYPNPFNPVTTIKFDLPRQTFVSLSIYNVLGQKIRSLINEVKSAGHHQVDWNGVDDKRQQVAGGIFFYQLKTDEYLGTKKMILLR